ncbi:MFS transporter [Marinicauda algicola]|uniref:MFS transporter n=1 Tax=Marinicauda algicola TaxID=2029849 RepID=A0A4S2GWB7_9PROT|nr:MFS transporter [Marinicauda algicola]
MVSLGGFVFGYDAVVISGVSGAVAAQFALSEWQVGWVVSAPTLSAMFASLAAGYFSDRLGRRTMLRVVAVLYVISSILSAFASGFHGLVFARAVGGLAFSSLVLAPVYLAEISPSAIRGRIVAMNQLAIVLGLSSAYFCNLGLTALGQTDLGWVHAIRLDEETWRWMLGAELLPAVSWLIALFAFTPESPRWLVLNGRVEEAREVLLRLHVRERAEAILARIGGHPGAPPRGAQLDILFSRPVRIALGLGLIVGCAQQITGVNAIYFYAPIVFEQTGVGTDAALFQAALIGVTNVVFTVAAMVLVDRVGRKPLLLAGLGGVTVSTLLVAYAFSEARYALTPEAVAGASEAIRSLDFSAVYNATFISDVRFKAALLDAIGADAYRAHQSEILRLAITMNAGLILLGILLFVASFAISLGPVTWIFLSEIFPNAVRGTAIALVAFVNGLVSFLVQLLFPAELAQFGAAATFAIYGIIAVFFFIAVAAFLPETRGRPLEASG